MGRSGAVVPEAGKLWTPKHHGLKLWSADPQQLVGGSQSSTKGFVMLSKLLVPEDTLFSTLWYGVITAGVGMTANQNGLGVYNSAGALLGQTADLSGPFASTGAKSAAVVAPFTVIGGPQTFVWVASLTNGSGATVALAALYANSTVTSMASIGMAGTAGLRAAFVTVGSKTAFPNNFTPGTDLTALGASFWYGVS